MEKATGFLWLIESQAEPSFGVYEKVLRNLVNSPLQFSQLVDEDADRSLIFNLLTRHHRLAKLFKVLQQSEIIRKDSRRVREIAESIVTFLTYVIPSLSGDIENKHILDVLEPALAFCLPHRAPGLRRLAAILTDCERLLEDLLCGPGQKLILQWIGLSHGNFLDISTLDLWTSRFVELVKKCPTDHGVTREVNQYNVSSMLRMRLQEEKWTLETDEARLINRRAQRSASLATHPPARDDELINLLQQAELPSCGPLRTVQSNLETLSSRIISSLQVVVSSFPCKLCGENLPEAVRGRRHHLSSDFTVDGRTTEELALDVLGTDVGPWKILLSSLALSRVQSLGSTHFTKIKESLKSLASGEFRSTLFGEKHQRARLKVPLASTTCGLDIMILWQVDVEYDEGTVQKQVIKIWEIGNDQDLQKAFERVSKLQQSFSLERIRHCLHRSERQNQRQIPYTFEGNLSLERVDSKPDEKIDVRALDQQTIEMAQKFYAVTEPLLAARSESLAEEFPMNMSPEERRVISHISTSTLILGRSGTGKTTCLVFKLVAMYLSSKKTDPNQPAKQVLLTRSTHLTEKLRTYTKNLIQTLMSRSSDQELQEGHRLDIAACANPNALEHGVLDLQIAMYPLVCTFDQLLGLIENTIRAFSRSAAYSTNEHRKQLIDFETFKTEYWPHLPSHITKKLPIALVFAEIMGVIKGSAASRKLLSPLSRSEYLQQSSRLAPTFVLDSDRSALYDFYESYESYKERHEGFDYVDRVISVMKAMRKDEQLRETLSKAFDEIFIDEVQDHRILDIQMLLDIVKDSRGFHFAGDTAQTISYDSTFRFQDIKSLMYEHFAAASSFTGLSDLSKPRMFTLAKNYRSHQGVVELASLIMKLLWKGFPKTVDKLEPESAQLNGPKPVLFLECEIKKLVSGEVGDVKLSDRAAEFGAEQVVLVRDEKTKEKLHEIIGDSALILTILQAKGMEFNDVILWDFFSRSSYPAALRCWRQLLSDERSSFDTHKYGNICSDLKHLYVAITRARIHFFLFESLESVVHPIVQLLIDDISEPLIELIRPNHPNFAKKMRDLRPEVISDPVGWCRRGFQLMEAGSYRDALFCFSKGNSHRNETIAKGKIHEQDGHVCDAARDRDGFVRNFDLALECYKSVGAADHAIKVCLRLSKYEEAAKICVENEKFQEAASYYRSSGFYNKASNCFHKAGDFVSAVDVLRQGSHFDGWVSYLCENRERLSSDSFGRHTSFVKLVLKQKKISPNRYKSAIELLGSPEDQENFYREYEMNKEMAELYSKQQRYADLFQLELRIGQFEKALDLALHQRLWDQENAVQEALIEKLLDYVCAGRVAKQDDKELSDFMDEARPKSIFDERFSQWKACLPFSYRGNVALETSHSVAKNYVLILRFKNLIEKGELVTMTETEGIYSDQIDTLMEITQELVLTASERAWSIVLLAAGVWQNEDAQQQYSSMAWSPIRSQAAGTENPDLPHMAKEWFLNIIAIALMAMYTGFMQRLKTKWPTRCVYFLTRGRRLLEELLRKITYITAHEQVSSVILGARNAIFVREQFPTIATCLQELLYYKNTKDWRDYDDLCSFLEQLQLARIMGK
ncbi:MAG: hypothetical protein Q9167_003631 [Letrouitia subvulpina]